MSKALDLWSIVEREQHLEEGHDDPCIVVLGNSKSGKSSLIQCFLKPTVTKDPKPTVALDYNFARKKAGSGDKGSQVSPSPSFLTSVNSPNIINNTRLHFLISYSSFKN